MGGSRTGVGYCKPRNMKKKNKLNSSTITQLTVQKKEEIFSGETQKKLLEILNNI